MALACDQENVAVLEARQGVADGDEAIAGITGAGERSENRSTNVRGGLGARVAIRDEHTVSQVCSDPAHHRALCGIAVAAASEEDVESRTFSNVGTQAAQSVLQGIGRVCKVDVNSDFRNSRRIRELVSLLEIGLGVGAVRPAFKY